MVFGMRKFLSLSLLGVLLLGSCQIRVPKEEIISVTQVTLSQATAEMVIGETVQLIATVLPANANEKSVNWASSAQSVAGVDQTGKVTALAEGSSTITASCGGKSATCQVTVSKAIVPVASVTLDRTELELTVGDETQLVATVSPADATDKTLLWLSSNPMAVSVDQDGRLKALSEGSAVVTASAGGKSATCRITVKKAVIPVGSVSLDRIVLSLEAGQSTTLVATVSPADATDKTVTWSSSDASVATVGQDGLVTAVKEGTAVITAAAGGKSATCEVTVRKKVIPVTAVSISRTSLQLIKGQSESLTATVSPADATDKTVTWSSSDATVVSVDQTGKVNALNGGAATVTASAGEYSATCRVTVTVPVTGISLDRTALNLDAGQTATLAATVSPADATDKTVTWSSSDATVVSVDQTGKVTALKGGAATVTASAGEYSATCRVTVTVPVTGISLDRTALSLEATQTTTLVATVSPSDATDKSVTWSSSNASVATVGQDGLVTAVREGTAVITAAAGGKSATCNVTVRKQVIPVSSVTLDKARLNLTVGAVETLTATVLPENATDRTVTWSSTDETVATVDRSGKVTALKGGTATIRAAAGERSATAFVDVLAVTPGSVEVEGVGGRFDVTVFSDRAYHISSKPGWITEISVENQVHHFEAAANDADRDRTGVIAFCDEEGACLSCVVRQKGIIPFSVSPSSVEIGYKGGTFEVTVRTSFAYSLSDKPDWISESSVQDGTHVFQVAANPVEAERSGVVSFCNEQGLCVGVSVRQAPRIPDPDQVDWGKEFFHRSLLMVFTGTWVSWYPEMYTSIQSALERMPGKIEVVNVHTPGSQLEFSGCTALRTLYHNEGPISSVLDGRRESPFWEVYSDLPGTVTGAVSQRESSLPTVSAVGLESSFSGQKLSVTAHLFLKEAGDYKVTVLLVEDDIRCYQAGSAGGYDDPFRHDGVVRASLTSVTGDAFTTRSAQTKVSRDYSLTLPDSYAREHLRFVVYVQRAYGPVQKISESDFDGYFIDNCVSAKAGTVSPPDVFSIPNGGNEDISEGNPINW